MLVRIYIPTKANNRSLVSKNTWKLEFVNSRRKHYLESLMGRTSSNDMMNEVSIYFATLDSALNFANTIGYRIEVLQHKSHKITKKSYGDNFKCG